MFSPKLKWPRETRCIPNSTLQPISDQNETYFIYGIPSFITHDNDSMTLQYRLSWDGITNKVNKPHSLTVQLYF